MRQGYCSTNARVFQPLGVFLHKSSFFKGRRKKRSHLPMADGIESAILVADEGQKSCLTSTLDSDVNLSLVLSTSAGDAAGQDLASLADELGQLLGVLVINVSDLVCAENANLLSLVAIEGARGTSGILGSIHLNPPVVVSRLIH
jgi:hypothetical protein